MLTTQLKNLPLQDKEEFGTKATNLAYLMRKGLPVPDGFAIATPAFQLYLEHHQLLLEIRRLAEQFPFQTITTTVEITNALFDLFNRFPLPLSLHLEMTAILNEYDQEQPFAVRSSAVAEDTVLSSFAGLYTSILDCRGQESIEQAIKKVWISHLVICHRTKKLTSMDDLKPGMGVLIQKMIKAEVAGVLFSRIADHERMRDLLLIEAVSGDSQSVTAGSATPDRYAILLDKLYTTSLPFQENADAKVPACALSSTLLHKEITGTRPLSDSNLLQLAELGLCIEQEQGLPQDIEWALDEQGFSVLQARPITYAVSVPNTLVFSSDSPRRFPFDRWSRTNVGEVLPGTVTPLSWSEWEKQMNQVLRTAFHFYTIPDLQKIHFFQLVQGKLYYNIGAVTHINSDTLGLPSLGFVLGGAGYSEQEQSSNLKGKPRFVLRRIIRHLPGLRRSIKARKQLAQRSTTELAKVRQRAEELRSLSFQDCSDSELLRLGQDILDNAFRTQDLHSGATIAAFSNVTLLYYLLSAWCSPLSVSISELVTNLDNVQIYQASLEIFHLSQIIKKDPFLLERLLRPTPRTWGDLEAEGLAGREIATLFTPFLLRYGHRSANELELLEPRWADDPHSLWLMTQKSLDLNQFDPEKQQRIQADRREQAIQRIQQHLTRRFLDRIFPFRWRIFHSVYRISLLTSTYRENNKHYLHQLSHQLRLLAMEMARRLCERAVLDKMEDLFFLTWPEIKQIFVQSSHIAFNNDDVKTIARLRRHLYSIYDGQAVQPVLQVQSDSVPVVTNKQDTAHTLEGIGVAGDSVQGRARVLKHLFDAEALEQGEIIVAPSIDAGWAPLFGLAGGVITEIGGFLSHGSILAREYGITTIVNVAHATHAIRTGQMLSLDGKSGHITLLEEQSTTPEKNEREPAGVGQKSTLVDATMEGDKQCD